MVRFLFALFSLLFSLLWLVKVFSSPPFVVGSGGGTPREEKRGIALTASYGARSHYPPSSPYTHDFLSYNMLKLVPDL